MMEPSASSIRGGAAGALAGCERGSRAPADEPAMRQTTMTAAMNAITAIVGPQARHHRFTATSTPRLPAPSLPHERAQVGHPPLGDLAHHLAHLLELLDQGLDRLDVRARSPGDPQPLGALDQLGPAALLRRHREDDRLQTVELALVELDPAQFLAEPRDHAEQVLQRPHAPDLAHLVEEVVQAERLLAQLALQLGGLLLVEVR